MIQVISPSVRLRTKWLWVRVQLQSLTIKDIKNLFTLKKESQAIKDEIIRDSRNLFEQEEKDYYKPVKVHNF